MEPEITVVIPVYNGEDFIAEAIESVLCQTFTRWVLVVSDNCSTDGTREVVRKYCSDRRVRMLENETNVGMAGNFNRCLDAVATRYYLLLCHDDYLYAPHALEAGYAALERNPAVAAVYCDLMFVNRYRTPIMVRRYHRKGLMDPTPLARDSILGTRNLFGIPLLVRRAAVDGLRYDTSLALALDLDLSIAMAKGRHIYHLDEPLIGNRYHGRNQTGVLLGRLLAEIVTVARKNGLPLRRRDLVRMRLSGYCTALARQAFLIYARYAKRYVRT